MKKHSKKKTQTVDVSAVHQSRSWAHRLQKRTKLYSAE